MSIQIFQFIDTGPAPVITTPSFTIGYVDIDVPAGGNAYIAKGTDIFPTSNDWILASRNEISMHLSPGRLLGVYLRIELSIDGIVWDEYHTYPLVGLRRTYITGQFLPGYTARFRLYNRDGAAVQTVTGNIQLRGK